MERGEKGKGGKKKIISLAEKNGEEGECGN